MRTHLVLAPVLAGALLLAACGDADDAAPSDATADPSSTAAAEDGAAQDVPVSEDLPDGVAATVGDTEVAVDDLEARLALVREIPEVAQQLDGDDTGQLEAQLISQALGQLVLQRVVLQGAAAEDVEVGDDEVDDRRSQLTEDAGGPEAFAEQLVSSGVPEDQVTQELRASIAFELVTEQLLADAGVEATASPTEGSSAPPSPDPRTQVQQEWLLELLTRTPVVVDEAYGAWDPNSGQVVPG